MLDGQLVKFLTALNRSTRLINFKTINTLDWSALDWFQVDVWASTDCFPLGPYVTVGGSNTPEKTN
jgi:hypothetical protein